MDSKQRPERSKRATFSRSVKAALKLTQKPT